MDVASTVCAVTASLLENYYEFELALELLLKCPYRQTSCSTARRFYASGRVETAHRSVDASTQGREKVRIDTPYSLPCSQSLGVFKTFKLPRLNSPYRMGLRGMLNVTVDFPLEGLDTSRYEADNVATSKYNLYAICNHSGSTYSGDYTAYCRHPYTGHWREYNDSKVSSISPKSLVSGEAYVPFYEQEDTIILNDFHIVFDGNLSQNPPEKLNVVVFFTEVNKIPESDFGIRFLQMHEMARVKHNTDLKNTRKYVIERNIENCKELLNNELESLAHFCQNALGMKTAIKTVYSNSPINAIPYNQFDNPQQVMQRRAPNKPPMAEKVHRQDETIPSVTKVKNFNKDNIILSPEHTEIFKIRVRRNASTDEDRNENLIGSLPENRNAKRTWDIFDIMSHVRFSFFGDIFEDGKKQKLAKEGNDILTNLNTYHNQVDSGLFETVSSTLKGLQEAPCEGFLMVVFGGHLHEISDIHSPLVQSLKHVMESTDPQNTLLIVTASCPEIKRAYNEVVEIREGAKNCQNLTVLPVYAKGPQREKLTQCTVLYDIPLTVKNILEEISPTFKGM